MKVLGSIPALLFALLVGMAFVAVPATAQDANETEALPVVQDLVCDPQVIDKPSDDGRGLIVTWNAQPGTYSLPDGITVDSLIEVRVDRRLSSGGPFERAGKTRFVSGEFEDYGLETDESYNYRLVLTDSGVDHASETTVAASPEPNFFRLYRINALVVVLMMGGLVVGFIFAARQGADLYIRRISGLDAINEAVGRATEMGRKILYIPGIISINEPQTLASLGILGYVAKLTAKYGTQLEVPNADPLTMAAAREIVKQSYLEAGSPEGFHEDMVHYITQDQFAYAGAVSGIMVRDKPAAVFLLGWFAAESLLLSETGQSISAIQIAGTAQVTQLPFFVAACDYTMLGEELFAASAYLSKDPLILGSIKGQDMMKAAILAMIVIGVVMATFGNDGFVNWFTAL
jgi:Domain of unknown function (DUF6754)